MNVGYRVELSQSERDELTALLSGGRHTARRLKRAQILLAADAGSTDDQIAKTVRVSGSNPVTKAPAAIPDRTLRRVGKGRIISSRGPFGSQTPTARRPPAILRCPNLQATRRQQ